MTGIDRYIASIEESQTAIHDALTGADLGRLHRRLGESEWSPAAIVAHVTEIQPLWSAKAVALARGNPAEPPYRTPLQEQAKQDAVAAADGATAPELEALLRESSSACLANLMQLTDEDLERTAPGSDGRPVTARWLVEVRLVEHLREHLHQLRRALASAGG